MDEGGPIDRRAAITLGLGGLAALVADGADAAPGERLHEEISAVLARTAEIWNSQQFHRLKDVWDADDPANSGNRGEFLAEARQLIGEARQVFQTAFEQHKAVVDAFPLGTSDESVVQRRKREDAENLYLHSKLDLAETTYWMAQTYEPGSTSREEQLTQAQDEYAKIHAEHRLQKVGLIARLWQGKCFEEMGRLGEDGFLLLVRSAADIARLEALARQIRERLARPVVLGTSPDLAGLDAASMTWVAELGVGVLATSTQVRASQAVSTARAMARTAWPVSAEISAAAFSSTAARRPVMTTA